MTRLLIHGAAGRMGKRLVAIANETADLNVAAAVDAPNSPNIGHDAGQLAGVGNINIPITDAWPPNARQNADVAIDFSLPEGFQRCIRDALAAQMPLVVGTTGLNDDDHAAIDHAAKTIPILQAPNMSLGVNLLIALAAQVAKKLGDDYDIEILEAHHRFKKDAPSGTAEAIINSICNATNRNPQHDVVHGRQGLAPRKEREIGVHAIRLGDVVGRHTVSYATLGEEIQLAHTASTRDVFVHGALTAARWLHDKPAGRYGMPDVLGLESA